MVFELSNAALMQGQGARVPTGRIYMKFEVVKQHSLYDGAHDVRTHKFELRIMGATKPWLSEQIGTAMQVAEVFADVRVPAAADDMEALLRCLIDNANPIMENMAMLFAVQNQLEYEVEQPLRPRSVVNKANMRHLVEQRSFAGKPFTFRRQP
jgi:hypothetical protein